MMNWGVVKLREHVFLAAKQVMMRNEERLVINFDCFLSVAFLRVGVHQSQDQKYNNHAIHYQSKNQQAIAMMKSFQAIILENPNLIFLTGFLLISIMAQILPYGKCPQYHCYNQQLENQMDEPTLPTNFADKLLELEACMEYQGTIETIRELNDLYRAGIDYFIEKDPKKALHLQKKMTYLLANPDNIRILEREIQKPSPTNEPLAEKKQDNSLNGFKERNIGEIFSHKAKLNTRKIKEEVNKFHSVADTCIQSIVENSNKVAEKIQKLKDKDLNKQEEQLKDRIMLKRVRSQEKINLKSLREIPAEKEEKRQGTPVTCAGSPSLQKFIE